MSTDRRVPFLDLAAGVAEQRAEIDAAIAEVLDSGWYIMGRSLERFEQEFGGATGVTHCLGVGNGLEALVLGLRALGVGAGDEVIVPANTYIATWLAVSQTGATPVPAEADLVSGMIEVAAVEAAITDRTRCILPVHLYGHVVDGPALRALATKHDLAILEDVAQAHLARDSEGRVAGNQGTVGAFSFYPGKNLGALGDGGAVTTSDDDIADRVRLLRNYGSRTKYVHEVRGGNSRLDELQAAILSVRLPRLEAWNARRREIAARYQEVVRGTEARMPEPIAGTTPVWHLAPVWHERRDELQAHLDADGIDTLIHYPTPPHHSGAYADEFAGQSWPVAERIARETLSLPIGPQMTDAQVDRVCESLARFLTR